MVTRRIVREPALQVALLAPSLLLLACGAPREADSVELVVTTAARSTEAVTNDLGYEIELTEARVMVENLTFAIGGELLTRDFIQNSYDWFIPSAHAHPGHYEGGDVTGELPGRFLLDWTPGGRVELETATLLAGAYRSANWSFCAATSEDLADDDDPMLGHTALLRGDARKGASSFTFEALIDIPDTTLLVGIPFEATVDTSTTSLQLELRVYDDVEDQTLFDGLDFSLLARDADGNVEITSHRDDKRNIAAHDALARGLQSHDHFRIVAER